MNKFEKIVIIFFSLIIIVFVLYAVIGGIYYWGFIASNIKGEIAPAWSWGKNYCGMLIYQEKLPLSQIPQDCWALLCQEQDILCQEQDICPTSTVK